MLGILSTYEHCQSTCMFLSFSIRSIHPQAIKYNKVFVDGYWNSREQSFAQHLFRLMTSWAVVCDVWFLGERQHIKALIE